jgi:hypothetical protein
MEWSFVRCNKDPREVPECVEERTLRGGIRPPSPWRYTIALNPNPNCRNRAKDAGNWLCLELLWGRGSCALELLSHAKEVSHFHSVRHSVLRCFFPRFSYCFSFLKCFNRVYRSNSFEQSFESKAWRIFFKFFLRWLRFVDQDVTTG